MASDNRRSGSRSRSHSTTQTPTSERPPSPTVPDTSANPSAVQVSDGGVFCQTENDSLSERLRETSINDSAHLASMSRPPLKESTSVDHVTHPTTSAVANYDTDDYEDYPPTAPKPPALANTKREREFPLPSNSNDLALSPYADEHPLKKSARYSGLVTPSVVREDTGTAPLTTFESEKPLTPSNTSSAAKVEHSGSGVRREDSAFAAPLEPGVHAHEDGHDHEHELYRHSKDSAASGSENKGGIVAKVAHMLSGKSSSSEPKEGKFSGEKEESEE